ncbi:type I methionyl aminopeptidase [Bifidobacterium sp.]|jgi:methionyl aminopeptidase|uniref:type I methionyl aminopeptidase n=1 Tax=Bifidobacterium sp. TaxID=41200 RepID=UPI0025C432EA|nr:type I methionyl aminopeptidase [Bifidobacterium sp.]MCH4210114.1 type I methionyl aminopeptidase [Bifidobacterium sp.]
MIELKTPEEINEMRPAGKFVGDILSELRKMTHPGTNLLEIDDYVRQRIDARPGAASCYVDYAPDFGTGPFRHYICASVNDAVLHGMPYDYALRDGDLLSLDLAITVDGWVGDSAISFVVGNDADPEDLRLIQTTRDALAAGIRVARAGNRLGDISAAVGAVAHERGYMVNLEFGGHGLGRIMHGDPFIPNDGKAHHGYRLRPGLVIAIEPWLLRTTDEIVQDQRDGWTIRSADGSRGAHTEHTLAITDGDPIILTAREHDETVAALGF